MAARAGHSHRRHRLSGHKKQNLDAVRNEINVTPLVDVCLVLLIIFMVAAPLMARGHEIPKLPRTRNHSKEKDAKQPVVAVDGNSDLWFDKEKLGPITDASLAILGQRVKNAWDTAKDPDGVGRIYVKASDDVMYGKMYPLLTFINNDLGVSSIDLATNELKDP